MPESGVFSSSYIPYISELLSFFTLSCFFGDAKKYWCADSIRCFGIWSSDPNRFSNEKLLWQMHVMPWNWSDFWFVFVQVDLRHIDEENGREEVEIGVDLTEYYVSVEWDILEVPAVRNVKYYTCCDEPYLDITFNVTMRRKTLFYTVNLIIPCMGISFLTVLVFYLPSDSGEKVRKELRSQWILVN